MNKEIKEILEDVKRHIDYVKVTKQSSIRDNEMEKMYDYITNLQKRLDFMIDRNDEKQDRIDKAIEYIKHSQSYGTMAQVMPHLKLYVNGDDLLNILKGVE